ncbi:E3 ubiquitin-protein ligase TRIM39-like [Engystomops pustulosus]|uniref:E3 ubiquitin-protein ligase TRIM39-like n=1 Tax=Engystomops pustulosus TaxID=76066 RepID=UPI003AFAB2B7
MASADLREELLCSICLTTYTDPVTLRCGHNFCHVCIDQVLNAQDESGIYFCPECREEFHKRPGLQRNITLGNVVERVLSTHPPQEEKVNGIFCTYCIHSPVPAVKSCLHCEASLCDDHLRVHSKGPEHVLTDPSTSLENRKCSVHKKILEYYCTEDAACICVSCRLDGEHRGHQVETLDEVSEKKKNQLRDVLQKLITKRKETEETVQSLEESSRKAQEKASRKAERVIVLFIDVRRRLDDLEKKILSDISRQKDKMSLSLSDAIHKLEIQKDELSRKMRHIEELCNMTDPLTVLQEPDTGDFCDLEEWGGDGDTGGHDGGDEDTGGHDGGDGDTGGHDGGDEDTGGHDGGEEDTGGHDGGDGDTGGHDGGDQGLKLFTCLSNALKSDLNVIFFGQGPADILLDVENTDKNIFISDGCITASYRQNFQYTGMMQYKNMFRIQETKSWRSQSPQVMSRTGFSSGRHYWDVDLSRSGTCRVGMCYPSIGIGKGGQAFTGDNKSWYFSKTNGNWGSQYSVGHGSQDIPISLQISGNIFRISLDYEAGELSFYELCDPIRHLHTFTTTFTEPLHAALWLNEGCIKISTKK